jgi:hypothetical protein
MTRRIAENRRTLFRAKSLGLAALLAAAALLVVIFGVSASAGSCSNPATLGASALEIDGNAYLVVDQNGCIDWLAGGSGTAFRPGLLRMEGRQSREGARLPSVEADRPRVDRVDLEVRGAPRVAG